MASRVGQPSQTFGGSTPAKFGNAKSDEVGASVIAIVCLIAAFAAGFAELTAWVTAPLSVLVIAARLSVAYWSYRSDPVHELAADWRETPPEPDLFVSLAMSQAEESEERFVQAMGDVTSERHWLEKRVQDAHRRQKATKEVRNVEQLVAEAHDPHRFVPKNQRSRNDNWARRQFTEGDVEVLQPIDEPDSTNATQQLEEFLSDCAVRLSSIAMICRTRTDDATCEHAELAAKRRPILIPSFFAYLRYGLTP